MARAIPLQLPRRPMVPRDPREAHRASSPLELFFDLCFVVAVAQAGSELHHGLAGGHFASPVISYAMAFFAVWWGWLNFTWFASAYDNDDTFYRLCAFVQMGGALIIAAGVPDTFHDYDFTTATIGYVVMRAGLIALWVRASIDDPAGAAVARRYAAGLFVIQLGWLARLALPHDAGVAALAPLVLGELAIPVIAERAGPHTPWHPEHVGERYGLFTIIVLGESILAATFAIEAATSDGGLSTELAAIAGGGMLVVFSIWWAYFERPSEWAPHHSLPSAFAWGYGHYTVFAAIAAFGAAVAVAVDRGLEHATIPELGAGLALALPAAVALSGIAALRALHGHGHERPAWELLGGAVACLAAAFAAPAIGVPAALLLLGCVTCTAVVVDARTTPNAPSAET